MTKFVITGVQRSGTTLLSFLLSNHPAVCMEDHSVSFRLIDCLKTNYQRLRPHYPQLTDAALLHELIEKDYKGRLAELLDYENLANYDSIQHLIDASIQRKLNGQGKTHWGDKSPGLEHYLADMLLLVPDVKILHIVRDGRATATSLHQRASKNLRLAAQSWVDGNLLALQYQHILGKKQFMLVRYEDILEAPEQWMRQVCAFLELDFHPAVLDPSQHDLTGGDASYVKTKLSTDKINRYQTQLSDGQIRSIEQIQGNLLPQLGYPLLQSHSAASIKPLSVWQRIWLNQKTNFAAVFRPYEKRLVDWQLVRVKVPFRKRMGFFLRMLTYDLISLPLFRQLFERKHQQFSDHD